jgi:hypothetical protein
MSPPCNHLHMLGPYRFPEWRTPQHSVKRNPNRLNRVCLLRVFRAKRGPNSRSARMLTMLTPMPIPRTLVIWALDRPILYPARLLLLGMLLILWRNSSKTYAMAARLVIQREEVPRRPQGLHTHQPTVDKVILEQPLAVREVRSKHLLGHSQRRSMQKPKIKHSIATIKPLPTELSVLTHHPDPSVQQLQVRRPSLCVPVGRAL